MSSSSSATSCRWRPSARSASIRASVASSMRSSRSDACGTAHGSNSRSTSGRAPHEAKCAAEEHGCLLWIGSGGLADEPLEPVEIDLTVLDDQLVAASPPHDAIAAERAPQVGHIDLQHLPRCSGGCVAPERVDQPVVRDRPAAREKQDREERPFLRGPEWDRPAGVLDLEGAQQAELHRATLTACERAEKRPMLGS